MLASLALKAPGSVDLERVQKLALLINPWWCLGDPPKKFYLENHTLNEYLKKKIQLPFWVASALSTAVNNSFFIYVICAFMCVHVIFSVHTFVQVPAEARRVHQPLELEFHLGGCEQPEMDSRNKTSVCRTLSALNHWSPQPLSVHILIATWLYILMKYSVLLWFMYILCCD